MRTLYDSVTPSAIPANAALVGGYVDGAYAWSDADWARFTHAVKVRIACFPRTNDGHVLDVEQGDATPVQAPGWVTMRRNAGVDPTVYCNVSTWNAVALAFTNAGVAAPHYWIAQYDGKAVIPSGAVAKQYNDPPGSGGNYDISAVADFWPGVDQGGPVTDPAPALMEEARVAMLTQWTDSTRKSLGAAPIDEPNGMKAWLTAQFAALSGALSADEAALVGAIKAQPTGGQVDVTSLANALAPVLAPLLPADATPQQVGAAVVDALAAHLATPA
ncbi:MAG TPA: hypothetical protein VFQ42_04120 [Mycobacterium sp.]|nr:hypothetical protein [Mycobacterium sp.]